MQGQNSTSRPLDISNEILLNSNAQYLEASKSNSVPAHFICDGLKPAPVVEFLQDDVRSLLCHIEKIRCTQIQRQSPIQTSHEGTLLSRGLR